MRRRAVEFDYWRHFVPHAPDIDLQVESGATSFYNLEREHIIQGAKNPETHESPSIDLSKIPTQRGWRMKFVPITLPIQGDVKSTTNGFQYFVPKQYVGVDCFNYILTNGTQESNVGRVLLDVVRGYTYKIDISYITTRDQYTFQLLELEDTELPIPEHQLLKWFIERPVLVYNKELDREQVETERKLLAWYELSERYDGDGHYSYSIKRNPDRLTMTFPTDQSFDGFPVGDTDVPYKADGSLGNVQLEVLFYFGEIRNSESRVITMNMSYIYGERWWDSGNIQRT